MYVAAAVKKGAFAEVERHAMSGGQVQGYLRWYGKLSSLRGYWPLVEGIAYSLRRPGEEREAIASILELYAEKWGCPAAEVHTSVKETVQRAVELHPDFASQVLGGISAQWDTLSFIQASVRWLSTYHLVFSNDGKEAFWQFWPMLQIERKRQYISEEDRWIVQEHNAGRNFYELAQELDYPIEKVRHIHDLTLERARMLLQETHRGPGLTIGEYLKSVGFLPWMDGIGELETTVKMVMDNPTLLESATEKLYPALAEKFGLTPTQAASRLRKVMAAAYGNNKDKAHGEYDEFFRTANLTGRNDKILDLLIALMHYIETEQAGRNTNMPTI